MEKLSENPSNNTSYEIMLNRNKLNELVEGHNKTVEAVKYLARRLNTGTDKGTLEENINQILNS